MAASLSSPSLTFLTLNARFRKPTGNLTPHRRCDPPWITNRRLVTRVAPIDNLAAAAAEPARAELTWQIIVGSVAGVTPFVVAGIEFSKRIMAQRRCEACNGSGLVLRERDYMKCPECGGFLPWQSWRRFFTG